MTVDANFPHRDSPRLQDFLDRGAQLSRRTHALGRRFTAEPELLREVEAFIEEARPLPGVRRYTTTGGMEGTARYVGVEFQIICTPEQGAPYVSVRSVPLHWLSPRGAGLVDWQLRSGQRVDLLRFRE